MSFQVLEDVLPQHLLNYEDLYEGYTALFGKVNYDALGGILNDDTRSLLHGLLEFNPEARLGYNPDNMKIGHDALMNHPFFGSIDWALLEAKQLPPPYIPTEEMLDVMRQENVESKSLTELLRDANKDYWCEEFNAPSTVFYPDFGPNYNGKMSIRSEDQYYFRKWNYVNPNLSIRAI